MNPSLLPQLESALKNASHSQLEAITAGINAYQSHPYSRTAPETTIIWEAGTTKLHDYNPHTENATPILFIPSLINRSYILDLSKKHSLTRFLAKQGFRPFLLEWNDPEHDELDFTIEDYITKRIDAAIERITQTTGKKVVLAGYCMGGLMALASAITGTDKVSGLILLATPWDFHVEELRPVQLYPRHINLLGKIITSSHTIPASAIQAMFHYANPQTIHEKFTHFSGLSPDSLEAETFVAIEQWVNDGISMARNVAKESMVNWVHHNTILNGQWRIKNTAITPEKLSVPCFIALPKHDRVVPQASAEPLAQLLPDNTTITRPDSGHVSMIVGNNAQKELWNPLVNWLQSIQR